MILVVAKTDPGAAAKGISLVAIETANAQGFSRGRKLDKIGMHAQDTSELFFDDVFIPEENLLGGVEGRGFEQLMLELAWERMSCAIGAVSSMEGALDVTVEYVRNRKAFGQPILDFQNTQFKLAECTTLVSVARTYIDQMMVLQLAGAMDATTAAMAKLWTTDTLWDVVDECLQLHGGYGYMTEYPIARFWADARVMRIYAGTNEIMKRIIARSL